MLRIISLAAFGVGTLGAIIGMSFSQPNERLGLWAAGGQRLEQLDGDQVRECASPDRSLTIRQRSDGISLVAKDLVSQLEEVPFTPYLTEILWAPDSAAFVINASDGGLVGTWDAYLYSVDGAGRPALRSLRQLIEPQATGVAQCLTKEVVNLGVAAWLSGSRELLVVLEVPPHSSCRNMGALMGYQVALTDWRVVARLPERTLRAKWSGSLGSRLLR